MQLLATSCWKQSKPEDSGATYLSTKRKKKIPVRTLYVVKISCKNKSKMRTFLDMLKQKEFVTNRHTIEVLREVMDI